jgi:hypothetical protein
MSFVKFMVNAVGDEVHVDFTGQLTSVVPCRLLVGKVHGLLVLVTDNVSTAISQGEQSLHGLLLWLFRLRDEYTFVLMPHPFSINIGFATACHPLDEHYCEQCNHQ